MCLVGLCHSGYYLHCLWRVHGAYILTVKCKEVTYNTFKWNQGLFINYGIDGGGKYGGKTFVSNINLLVERNLERNVVKLPKSFPRVTSWAGLVAKCWPKYPGPPTSRTNLMVDCSSSTVHPQVSSSKSHVSMPSKCLSITINDNLDPMFRRQTWNKAMSALIRI